MSDATRQRPPGHGEPAGFEDTVKDFWASRPRRPRDGRKLAGVAAGVGYRYGVDPVVVRVALVVTAIFGGIGICAYLLGWLFFPDERDEVSAFESMIGKGRSSVSKMLTLCLCLALIPTFSWAFAESWFNGGGFIGFGLLAAALYLLHRSRGQYNRPAVRQSGPTGFAAAAFTSAAFTSADVSGSASGGPEGDSGQEASSETTSPAGSPGAATAPAWDPLGAAPLAWDLPDPTPTATPVRPATRPPRVRRKSKAGIATLGVALVVAGTGAALMGTGTPWFSLQHVIGLVLGVLGIGLVAASFAGGGRGLIGLALPLGLVGVALTAVPFDEIPGGVGSIRQTPNSVKALAPSYERAVGEIELNLTQLPEGANAETSVQLGTGTLTVVVDRDADVTFTCSNGTGHLECFDQVREGVGSHEVSGTSLGPDGEGGRNITLEASVGLGQLEVRRA